jgi:hypothetical protein
MELGRDRELRGAQAGGLSFEAARLELRASETHPFQTPAQSTPDTPDTPGGPPDATGQRPVLPRRALRSCLYECSVMHHRLEPKEHHFRYRIFMFALDLDELEAASARVAGFSRNRWNFYTFRDDDHLKLPGAEATPLREKFTAWLGEHGVTLPDGARITLVTLPRVLGYIFNPVSFYFCADAAGAPLCAVAEVGNTFREMKLYLLREPTGENFFRLTTPKHFYVSPFSALDLSFDFKLRVPGETLDIHIDDRAGERRVLLSALTGRRAPLTTARLCWFTLKYPLITLKVIALIHWHALWLWLRRVPWHPKAADADLQRDVLHPHASLTHKSP